MARIAKKTITLSGTGWNEYDPSSEMSTLVGIKPLDSDCEFAYSDSPDPGEIVDLTVGATSFFKLQGDFKLYFRGSDGASVEIINNLLSGASSGGSSSSTSTSSGISCAGITVGVEEGTYTFDASEKTVTIEGLGTIKQEQIGVIVNITDGEVIYSPTDPFKGGTLAGNVLTLEYDTTGMADTDKLRVIINYNKGFDYNLDLRKQQEQSPLWNRYTDAETLVLEQDLTASYADFGSEIDVRGYKTLTVYIVADVNDSENVDLKAIALDSFGSSDEYEVDGFSVKELWTTGASDFKKVYSYDVEGQNTIQLQAIAGTVGGTAGDLTISIAKVY